MSSYFYKNTPLSYPVHSLCASPLYHFTYNHPLLHCTYKNPPPSLTFSPYLSFSVSLSFSPFLLQLGHLCISSKAKHLLLYFYYCFNLFINRHKITSLNTTPLVEGSLSCKLLNQAKRKNASTALIKFVSVRIGIKRWKPCRNRQ